MENLTIFNYNNTSIEFEVINGEVFANATKMCKAFNKTPYEFLRSDKTQRYVEALRKNNEVEFIETRNGGVNPGTWIHEKLILKLAQWLDVDFEIWCDEKIAELLRTGTVAQFQIPQTLGDALLLAGTLAKEKEILLIENQRLKVRDKFVDVVFDSAGLIDMSQVAKVLKLPYGRNKLMITLKEKGILFKDRNEPYQQYIEKGYFEIKQKFIPLKNKAKIPVFQTFATQKGLGFIAKLTGALVNSNNNLQLSINC